MAKIISMKKYENGWQFTVLGMKYRTNKAGEGLWQYCRTGNWFEDGTLECDWKQIRGLMQFSLSDNRNSAYNKIRREFGDYISYDRLTRKDDRS